MRTLRPLAYVALGVGYAQVVLGAVVRITGSGLGCGDEWPTCGGHWLPDLSQPTVVIEWAHRLTALLLFVSLLALIAAALRRRDVGGTQGVLRTALGALGLYVALALMGAVTVWLELPPASVVVHGLLAMLLLAFLVTAVLRAGGLGAARVPPASVLGNIKRMAVAGAALALVVVTLGGLTANVPGAAASCLGFPLCGGAAAGAGGEQHIQLTHRILAFLFFFHMVGLAISVRRRGGATMVRRAVDVALGVVVVQIVVAAALVTHRLPPALQSLHQAVGTLVWVTTFAAAMLARYGASERAPVGADAGYVARSERAMEARG